MSNNVKTIMGIAAASVKTVSGIAAASVKTVMNEALVLTVDQAINSLNTNLGTHTGTERRSWGLASCYDPDTNQVIFVYGDSRNNEYSTVVVMAADKSIGSAVVIQTTGSAFHNAPVYNTQENKIMINYMASHSSNDYYMVGGTVGTKTVTMNASGRGTVHDGSTGNAQGDVTDVGSYNPTANVAVAAFEDGSDSAKNKVVACTIGSDNSITVGTPVTFLDDSLEFFALAYDPDLGVHVVSYETSADRIGARVISFGGTGNRTLTMGTEALYAGTDKHFAGRYDGGTRLVYDTTNNTYHQLIEQDNNSNVEIVYFTVSGTTITWCATGKAQAFQGSTRRGATILYSHNRNKLMGVDGEGTIAYHLYTFDGTDYTYDSSTGVVNIETGLEDNEMYTHNNGMDGVDHSAFGYGLVFAYSANINGNGDSIRAVGIEVGT